MSRSPNAEQSLAIHKKNGVLLSAGAGSGKTFVIIEHIIFLISELKANSTEKIREELPLNLSKIVLMTFTKKAAGEMLVRLINRIEELIAEAKDVDTNNYLFWELVLRNVNFIQISTIHGFCHRLISSGVWPDLPSKIELHSSLAQKNKIKILCQKWFAQNKDNFNDVQLAHLSDFYKAMDEVFSSPELRIMWEKGQIKRDLNAELDLFFEEYLEVLGFKILFQNTDFISRDPDKLKKQGFQLLANFVDLKSRVGKISSKNFKEYIFLFENLSSFPRATKDMSELENELRLELKQLADFFKKSKVDLIALADSYDVFIGWEEKLFELFNYINNHYLSESGFSFSDLEYYVYKGLGNELALSKIQERFQYFIVDEFQDTSFVQFEILKKCSADKRERLFCVGDKKQAIYGFRGGELQVFENCSKLMGVDSNLSLKANYRSKEKVISFNNQFFEDVLPIGRDYEGLDLHTVKMEKQTIPNIGNPGAVIQYDFNLNEIALDAEFDIDIAEANSIFKIIEDKIAQNDIKSIAILYRKLKPSHLLIDLLRNSDFGFSAQIKINIDEDPIVILFLHAIRFHLNHEDLKRRENSEFFFKSILELYDIYLPVREYLNQFSANIKLLGVNASFWKMLMALGISNSLFNENAKLIEDIAKFGNDDPLMILKLIDEQDSNYSFEMITGKNQKINILSTHASKGLEYDLVILGGIHKNGRYEGMKKKVGNLPRSFKWKKSFDQKNYFKSPSYYIESEVASLKDFSESKRLFYVACTRAVNELVFPNLLVDGKEKSLYGNSWINAFRKFKNDKVQNKEYLLTNFQANKKDISYIQKDSLGVLFSNSKKVGIVSELSVTRLAALAQCPFKFYLKNICKLEADLSTSSFIDNENELEEVFYSSKERGTDLHYQISEAIKKQSQFKVKKDYEEIVSWVLSLIKNSNADLVISEQEIKFSFFGQMISAIPDLVLRSKNHIEVWDFKTGTRKINDEDNYQFQLQAYALGLSKVYNLNQEIEFSLKLIYLDQKEVVSNSLKLNAIETNLMTIWNKLDDFSQTNKNHCSQCEYSSMCKFSSHIASI